MNRSLGFVLTGLAVALLLGVLVSNVASPDPDGLESAVLKTQCGAGSDEELDACLERASGDPVYTAAPLPDYEITPLSGFLGVLATFAVAVGIVTLIRGGGSGRSSPGARSFDARHARGEGGPDRAAGERGSGQGEPTDAPGADAG
ncbi:MAG: hypothetical protein GEU81_03670 [Nitriliruptorales bacterium]|nr:hypothetical protein [Nitriliruptorales bacterium]